MRWKRSEVDESEALLSDRTEKNRTLRHGKDGTYGIFKIAKGKTLKSAF